MEITDAKQLNPWVSMWTRPRATIQQIIDTDAAHLVLVLAAIAGVSQSLDQASIRSAGDILGLSAIMIAAAIGGSIGGLISLYIGGALIRWTGSWIGGQGSQLNLRAAFAWSNVPVIWGMILWVPELALFGKELFTSEMPVIEASGTLSLLLFLFGVVEITIGIWAFVLFLKCVGQVQGFSAWKALGNLVLAALVIMVPLAVIAGFLMFLSGNQ